MQVGGGGDEGLCGQGRGGGMEKTGGRELFCKFRVWGEGAGLGVGLRLGSRGMAVGWHDTH